MVFGIMALMGCSNVENTDNEALLRCNDTSKGKMAEIENGFFYVVDEILYYADKTDLTKWVPVCNNPDCTHEKYKENTRQSCQAEISYELVQKGNNLYYFNCDEQNASLQGYIWKVAQDGSGATKVVTLPYTDEMISSGGGGWNHPIFSQDNFVINLNYLTEEGYKKHEILSLTEENEFQTLFSGIISEDDSMTGEGFFSQDSEYYPLMLWTMPGKIMYGIGGDDTISTTQYTDEGTLVQLWSLKEDHLEKLTIPEDVPLLYGYLSDNIFTYFEQNKGFYEINLDTGEKTLLVENQIEDSCGYVWSEEYWIETNRDEDTKQKEIYLKVYNQKEWIDVQVAEEIQNSNEVLYPVSVASDRIFFAQNTSEYGYTKNLYYMMLDAKNPELIFCTELGTKVKEEEQASEEQESVDETIIDIEDIVLWDTEDYFFKITHINPNGKNGYSIEFEWENRSEDTNYDLSSM